jgi:hypothetical protein
VAGSAQLLREDAYFHGRHSHDKEVQYRKNPAGGGPEQRIVNEKINVT